MVELKKTLIINIIEEKTSDESAKVATVPEPDTNKAEQKLDEQKS